MRIPRVIRGGLAVCAILTALAFALHVGPFWAPTVVTSRICPGASVPQLGFPAIAPRNTCTPAFTAEDVRDYVQTGFSLGPMGPVTHVTVDRILFTTNRDATQLMDGAATGLPDDAIVCYAEVHGIPSSPATYLPVATARRYPMQQVMIKVVFDAHSGNEFESSTH
jgi:hypothetical protein